MFRFGMMRHCPPLLLPVSTVVSDAGPIDIGARRDLHVNQRLFEELDGARLVLHRPQPREAAIRFDSRNVRNVIQPIGIQT